MMMSYAPMMSSGYGPMSSAGGYGAASQEYAYELTPMGDEYMDQAATANRATTFASNESKSDQKVGQTLSSPKTPTQQSQATPEATPAQVGANQLEAHFRLPDRRWSL